MNDFSPLNPFVFMPLLVLVGIILWFALAPAPAPVSRIPVLYQTSSWITKTVCIAAWLGASFVWVTVWAQICGGTGGWNDLEWIGVKTLHAFPSPAFFLSCGLQYQRTIAFNVAYVGLVLLLCWIVWGRKEKA